MNCRNVAFGLFQRDEVEYLRTSRSALIECGGILEVDVVDINTLFESHIVDANAKIDDVSLDRISKAKAKKAKAKSIKYKRETRSFF